MASYIELFDLRSNEDLRNKVAVAIVIKAAGLLRGSSPTVSQVTWANEALITPMDKAKNLLNFLLADNNNLTVAQIVNATDSAIQTKVDIAVDALIAGGA